MNLPQDPGEVTHLLLQQEGTLRVLQARLQEIRQLCNAVSVYDGARQDLVQDILAIIDRKMPETVL